MEWLDPDDLLRLEPGFNPEVSGGVLSRDEKSLNPGRLTRAFARCAIQNGARLRTACPALGVTYSNGKFLSLQIPGEEISGGSLVLAAGAWTGLLSRWFDVNLPIRPARGQMISIRADNAAPKRSIFSYGGSVLPRLDGSVFVGATIEDVGFDRRNIPEGISKVLDMIPRLFPDLSHCPLERMWSGLRPRSGDDAPVIGHVPGTENVTVTSGHFKMGITAAPLTAEIVRNHLMDGKTSPFLDAFNPSRFFHA